MSERLPSGWVEATLGDVTRPMRNTADPSQSPNDNYVGLEHVEPQTMRLLGHRLGKDVRSRSLRFWEGDVLYSRMRPYLNKVWIAEFDGLCSGEFLVFPRHGLLNNSFLAARLNADDFVEFAQQRTRGERPRVSFRELATFEILLPPIAEQGRIAKKLKAVLSRLRDGEASARYVGELVGRYREALVHSAVTGEMSKRWRHEGQAKSAASEELAALLDMRRKKWEESEIVRLRERGKQPDVDRWKSRYRHPSGPVKVSTMSVPEGWTWASIDQLSWAAGYGTSVKCTYDAEGPRVLRIPNVRSGTLDLSDVKFATKGEFGKTSYVQPGDMLLVRTNGSKTLVGRATVILERLKDKYTYASYLIRYRLVGSQHLWSWVALAWHSDLVRNALEAKAKTTAGQYNLSLRALCDVAIPLPPSSEQKRIVKEVSARFKAADALESRLQEQLSRAQSARKGILKRAFAGELVEQDGDDQPASAVLDQLRGGIENHVLGRDQESKGRDEMKTKAIDAKSLEDAWERTERSTDARELFLEAGFKPNEVVKFYELLRSTPVVLGEFEKAREIASTHSERIDFPAVVDSLEEEGRFRIIELWLDDFKNLKDFTIAFTPDASVNAILGWNGTGKSNLFEALVIVFRDLNDWQERNRWASKHLCGFRITYELSGHAYQVSWNPSEMARPLARKAELPLDETSKFKNIDRSALGLPRFIFGYYAGPTNRFAEHFLPMKQAHYDRLRESVEDDPTTLNNLLERRRFFCAETHHAKYVLLAFSYREDRRINEFLANRLSIVGFESALFVVRKPRWARSNDSGDFWGAKGIMRRVMERLRRHAVAPLQMKQRVRDGYRSATEELHYFYLPDRASLHAFAAEYADARAFFLALESTDFSELIHDLKIQVRIKSAGNKEVPITFYELSEGEQQLLMVLGLMRFTQSKQSLVLLDEPDTHLNPHWSAQYLADLRNVVQVRAAGSDAHSSSQILIATHDPLIIGSLLRDQVQLLERDPQTGASRCIPASVNPRGLGVAGILTSEMFGFRSDLDAETLDDLDARAQLLAGEKDLSEAEEESLKELDSRLIKAGFSGVFSDPYYAAFVRAWRQRLEELDTVEERMDEDQRKKVERIAREALSEVLAELELRSNE